MATEYVGSWFATILELVVILDAMALALAICVTMGRGFFALARDGLLPSFFAKKSRFDTPWAGNLVVAVGGIGLMLLSWLADYGSRLFLAPDDSGNLVPTLPDGFATFILSATIGSLAVELVYLILAVAAFGLVRQAGNKWWQYAIVAIAVLTPILGYLGALKPEPHDRSNVNWEALYWTIGVVVVALLWFLILMLTRRRNVDNAARCRRSTRRSTTVQPRSDRSLVARPRPRGRPAGGRAPAGRGGRPRGVRRAHRRRLGRVRRHVHARGVLARGRGARRGGDRLSLPRLRVRRPHRRRADAARA
jgi:amino acid transporter